MLISGGVSPRTISRLDPTLKREPHRPCRQSSPHHHPVGATGFNLPANERGLFFIDKARAAQEELEGNRRVPSPSESSRSGRASPFHGYFPKIVDDTTDGLERRTESSSKFTSRTESPSKFSCRTENSLRLNSRTESPSGLDSRTESPSKLISRVDSRLQSSYETLTLPPSRPPSPVCQRELRQQSQHSFSRSTFLPSPESQFSANRRSPTPRSCATPPNSVATGVRHTRMDSYDDSVIDDDISVNAIDVVSLANDEVSHRQQKHENVSCAMHARQHTRAPRSIPGEQLAAKRHRLDNERRYLDLKFNDRPCIRSESFLNEELWGSVNDLSRECCDVLGPRHCHDCEKLHKRSDATIRSVDSFPTHMTAEQLATMNVVRRIHPELSPLEVLQRLEYGDISMPSLRRDKINERIKNFSKSVGEKEPLTRRRTSSISAFNIPDGQGFFANIADLRTQLLRQQGGRRGRRNAIFELHEEQAHLPPIENVELVPKEEADWENPANYFSPPLLSRDEIKYQQSQPRFYAGESTNKYELPVAPDLDTLLSKSSDTVRKIQSELASYKDANGIKDSEEPADEEQWAKNRVHSARSCLTTSTLDTDIVFTAAYDQMRSEHGILDVEEHESQRNSDHGDRESEEESDQEQE